MIASVLLLALATLVQADYFTVPQPGTQWATSQDKTMTWLHQAGSPNVGTFRIRTAELVILFF